MAPRSGFTQAIADAICARLSEGESLRSICRSAGMPSAPTVCGWVKDDKAFAEQYARARDVGLDLLADEIIAIADTPEIGSKTKTDAEGQSEVTEGDMIEHRRLRVEARKWYLSKLAPKRYGDKLALEHSGQVSIADALRQAKERRKRDSDT